VLRITTPTREDAPKFILEGRLAGEWVQELLRVTRKLCPGTKSVFDIEDVFFVDSLGEKALQWLNRLGATFVAQNAYGVNLCERLHLRRSTADESAARGRHTAKRESDLGRGTHHYSEWRMVTERGCCDAENAGCRTDRPGNAAARSGADESN
jgi:hypothetical protein